MFIDPIHAAEIMARSTATRKSVTEIGMNVQPIVLETINRLEPYDYTDGTPPKDDIPRKQKYVVFKLKGREVYDGQYTDYKGKSNVKNGKGVKLSNNGSFYEGYWLDNKRSGKGRIIYPDGSYYTGNWKDDMIHGQGYFFDENGTTYQGAYKNGLEHGVGKKIYPDGTCYFGKFEEGEFKSGAVT